MSFGKYLLAIFLPPFYLYSRKRWFGGTINLFFWLIAWLMLITIILAVFSIVPWAISCLHAMWHLRREMMEEHATMMADKMVAAMKKGQE